MMHGIVLIQRPVTIPLKCSWAAAAPWPKQARRLLCVRCLWIPSSGTCQT